MKLVSVLLLITLVFSVTTGLAESTSMHASSFVQKLLPQIQATDQPTPPSEPTPSPAASRVMANVGRIGVYTVEIKDASLMADGEGNDCLVVTFEWSHESNEEQSFLWSFSYEAFQDGNSLHDPYMSLPIDTEFDYFKAGAKQLTQVAYLLENRTSPVRIEVSEYMGESGDSIQRTFDITRLTKLAPMPTQKPEFSPYIGTAKIVKAGYMTAYYDNNVNSGAAFRVHHGERFLCLSITSNNWYEILFIDGTIGFVTGKDGAVVLESRDTDGVTFSDCDDDAVFVIETIKNADAYSQPKSGGQARRESGGTSETFYFPARSELYGFGKTYRQGKEWYVLLLAGHGNSNVPEIAWLQADDCIITEGNPSKNIIPGWWYD